jgi:hypothetical protein
LIGWRPFHTWAGCIAGWYYDGMVRLVINLINHVIMGPKAPNRTNHLSAAAAPASSDSCAAASASASARMVLTCICSAAT